MIRWLFLVNLFLAGCASPAADLLLPEVCPEPVGTRQAVDQHWLNGAEVWRLRQSVLITIGGRKIPLEGFMVLDLAREQIRLVAMNELGVVLFELLVTDDSEQLLRAVPPLRQQPGLAQGIAGSLRRIYQQPRPRQLDKQEQRRSGLRLWRTTGDEHVDFVFDCTGHLRQTVMTSELLRWQVFYHSYRPVDGEDVPEHIVLKDYGRGVTLNIRLQEATRQP